MTEQENLNKESMNPNSEEKISNCGCSDPDCCSPKPRAPWQKWVFLVIVLAAVGLIAYKLVCKPACCDTSKGCCPKDSTECVKK